MKFVVGAAIDDSPTEFTVHVDAIAQLSTALHSLTNSSPEARAGRVTWKHVGKETFERFAQFAYTGDYSIPKTEKRSAPIAPKTNGIHLKTTDPSVKPEKENGATNSPSPPTTPNGVLERVNSVGSEPTGEAHDWSISEILDDDGTILNYHIPSKKGKKTKKKAAMDKAEKEAKEAALKAEKEAVPEPESKVEAQKEARAAETKGAESNAVESHPEPAPVAEEEKPLQESVLTADFPSLSYPLLASRDNYEGTCEPATNFEKDHTYSNVLLSHASLYVLGDGQLVESLKALALFKLHKTLCAFELHNENIGDVTDLARYAYSGEDKVIDGGIGGLRELVCQYMAIHSAELGQDERFMDLLGGGGQFVKDFFKLQLQMQKML